MQVFVDEPETEAFGDFVLQAAEELKGAEDVIAAIIHFDVISVIHGDAHQQTAGARTNKRGELDVCRITKDDIGEERNLPERSIHGNGPAIFHFDRVDGIPNDAGIKFETDVAIEVVAWSYVKAKTRIERQLKVRRRCEIGGISFDIFHKGKARAKANVAAALTLSSSDERTGQQRGSHQSSFHAR